MKLGLGLGFAASGRRDAMPTFALNFTSATTLPEHFTHARSSAALYQDQDGYWQNAPSNTPRFTASLFGLGSGETARGLLLETWVNNRNHYARPSSGLVSDHLSAGASIASVVTDTDNPCKELSNGTDVWLFDNSGGGADVNIEFEGSATTTTEHSAFAYIKTLSGSAPTLSISGNGSSETGHQVAGYDLHQVEDVSTTSGDTIRIIIPAGATCRVACANLQEYRANTSLIDTAGASAMRYADELYMDGANSADWYQETGTFFFDYTFTDYSGKTGDLYSFSNTGTMTDNFSAYQLQEKMELYMRSSGVSQMYYVDNTYPIGILRGQRNRLAIPYALNDAAVVENGFTVTSDDSFTPPRESIIKAAPVFTMLQRSGTSAAARMCGILHGFQYYPTRLSNEKCEKLTNPNSPAELVVSMFGDSNLLRWSSHYSGAAGAAFADDLSAVAPSVLVSNNGDSSSSCSYVASTVTGGDYWYYEPTGTDGTSLLQAIRTDADSLDNRLHALRRRVDYVIINHGIMDTIAIRSGALTQSAFKLAMTEMLDHITAQLGDQVRYVLQGLASTTQVDGVITDAAMQAVRDTYLELTSEDPRIIGYYDIYDGTLTDGTHPNESGLTANAARAANIIAAHNGTVARIAPPEITHASYNGANVILESNAGSLSGTEYGLFRVTDDGAPVTITAMSITDGTISLTLSSPIAGGSDVKLWVAYGKMAGITPAQIPTDSNDTPLLSASEMSVTDATGV